MGLFDFLKNKREVKGQEYHNNFIQQSINDNDMPSEGAHPFIYRNATTSNIEQEPPRDSYYKLADIKVMQMGSLMLCPYDAKWYFQAPDASLLPLIANTEKIKKHLPGLNFNTEESCKKQLEKYMLQTEKGYGFTYVIRAQNCPIGMLFIESPKYNDVVLKLRIWTISFFIIDAYEHNGIMYKSIIRIMNLLNNIGVHNIYAIVDPTNVASIRLLDKCMFTETDNSYFWNKYPNGDKPLVFKVNLPSISFQTR